MPPHERGARPTTRTLGAVAQLGERLGRIEEVVSSTLIRSTCPSRRGSQIRGGWRFCAPQLTHSCRRGPRVPSARDPWYNNAGAGFHQPDAETHTHCSGGDRDLF